jgi:hypothetical protein
MGLFVPALFTAIDNRLSADTTLLALLGTGTSVNISNGRLPPATDPPGSTLPCVVFKYQSDAPDDAFSTRRYVVTFQIEMYVEDQPALDSANSPLILEKIFERVLGDWPGNGNNRVPVYGLDRWIPDFSGQSGDSSTVYSSEMMIYKGSYNDSDAEDGRLKKVSTYEVALDLRST